MSHESILEKPRTPLEKEAATAQPDIRPADGNVALFAERDTTDFRKRWSDIQAAFVDEPRRSVEQADALVADVTNRLTDRFGNERASLERQWDSGNNVTTEDLRVALQRYRSFFDRLLTI